MTLSTTDTSDRPAMLNFVALQLVRLFTPLRISYILFVYTKKKSEVTVNIQHHFVYNKHTDVYIRQKILVNKNYT